MLHIIRTDSYIEFTDGTQYYRLERDSKNPDTWVHEFTYEKLDKVEVIQSDGKEFLCMAYGRPEYDEYGECVIQSYDGCITWREVAAWLFGICSGYMTAI